MLYSIAKITFEMVLDIQVSKIIIWEIPYLTRFSHNLSPMCDDMTSVGARNFGARVIIQSVYGCLFDHVPFFARALRRVSGAGKNEHAAAARAPPYSEEREVHYVNTFIVLSISLQRYQLSN